MCTFKVGLPSANKEEERRFCAHDVKLLQLVESRSVRAKHVGAGVDVK